MNPWDCPLSRWQGEPGRCRWCNKELPRNKDGSVHKSMRWCGTVCTDAYGKNHWWTSARAERVRIDGDECARCGWERPEFAEPEPPKKWRADDGYYYPRTDAEWSAYNEVRHVHQAWLLRQREHLRTYPPLEVNHVFPLAHQKRKHADTGCHHHLSLLVTLCKPCHRRITNQQFGFKQPSPQMSLESA